jgi:hypothetical protein
VGDTAAAAAAQRTSTPSASSSAHYAFLQRQGREGRKDIGCKHTRVRSARKVPKRSAGAGVGASAGAHAAGQHALPARQVGRERGVRAASADAATAGATGQTVKEKGHTVVASQAIGCLVRALQHLQHCQRCQGRHAPQNALWKKYGCGQQRGIGKKRRGQAWRGAPAAARRRSGQGRRQGRGKKAGEGCVQQWRQTQVLRRSTQHPEALLGRGVGHKEAGAAVCAQRRRCAAHCGGMAAPGGIGCNARQICAQQQQRIPCVRCQSHCISLWPGQQQPVASGGAASGNYKRWGRVGRRG